MGPSLPRSPGTMPAGPASLRLREGAGHGDLSHQGGGGHGTGPQSLICLDWTQEPHLQQPSAGSGLAAMEGGLRVWRTGQRRKHRRTGKAGGGVTRQPPQDAPSPPEGRGPQGKALCSPGCGRAHGPGEENAGFGAFRLERERRGFQLLPTGGDRTPVSGLLGRPSDCPVLAEILSSRYDPVVWPGSSPPYPTGLPPPTGGPPSARILSGQFSQELPWHL